MLQLYLDTKRFVYYYTFRKEPNVMKVPTAVRHLPDSLGWLAYLTVMGARRRDLATAGLAASWPDPGAGAPATAARDPTRRMRILTNSVDTGLLELCEGPAPAGVCPNTRPDGRVPCAGRTLRLADSGGVVRLDVLVEPEAASCPLAALDGVGRAFA
jgi:hypothetical protein